jgi:hypothetical protein
MKCRNTQKLLSAFLDGELPKIVHQEVSEHLEDCSRCRAELESLRKIEALSRQSDQPEPGDAYWQEFLPRLGARIAREGKRPLRIRFGETWDRLFAPPVPWIRLAGVVATAVLVFFVGRAVYQHEVRMRGIRTLPKRLLTDQAQQAEESRGEKSLMEQMAGDLAEEEAGGRRQEDLADADMDDLTRGDVAPGKPSDERLHQAEGIIRSKKEDLIAPTPPISPEKTPMAGDLVTTLEADIHGDKMRQFAATGEDVFESAAKKGAATAAGSSDSEHWRHQIQTWQDFIKDNPRDDRLRDAHLRLADSWFQLARLTEEEQDMLQALRAQQVALDFAEEEYIRQLLRDRIFLLEERLEKK